VEAGGECAECKKKRLKRQALSAPTPAAIPTTVHDTLRTSGHALDLATRAAMELRFGHSFAHVRIHADERAAESARDVNALAYTVGRDVVFGAGQFRPESETGRRLLAHELVHTIQQRDSENGAPLSIVGPDDHSEREADEAASAVVSGGRFLPNEKRDAALARKATSERVAPQAERTGAERGSTECCFLGQNFDRVFLPQNIPLDSPPPSQPNGDKIAVATSLSHPVLQRKKEDEQSLLLMDAPEYPGCSPYQRFRLQNQIERARNMVGTAISAVSDELARKDRTTGTISVAGSAISRYFNTTDATHIRTMLRRLNSIQKILRRKPWNWRCLSDDQCRKQCDSVVDACAATDSEVFICSHWGEDNTGGAQVLVHETAHQAGIDGDIYDFDPKFAKLTTAQALENADSYADLARDISYGQTPAYEVWIPQDMWLSGWFDFPSSAPGFGTGPFTGRVPATVIVENHLKGGFSYHSAGASLDRRRTPRPTYLRQPIVSLKIVLHRTGSAKELGDRPRESVLFDLSGRAQQGQNHLFIPPESVDNAYRFEFSFDQADRGTLDLTGQLRDEDTVTTLTHREKLQVRPTTASGSTAASARPSTKQPPEAPPRYPRLGAKHWKEMINETTLEYEPASWRPSLIYIHVSSDRPGCEDYVFGPRGSARTCKGPITPPTCQNANIVFDVAYVIDHFDWPHPSPIYPLKVEALLEFTPRGGRTREVIRRIDAAPKYLGPQQPLATNFGRKFPFSTSGSGRLRIRFEVVESTGIRVVYDDGIDFAILPCKQGPAK
jgi:hypothetical protein